MKEQIDYLKSAGIYKQMLASGLISLKIDFYYDIYETYNTYLQSNISKMDALTFTAMDSKVAEGTVSVLLTEAATPSLPGTRKQRIVLVGPLHVPVSQIVFDFEVHYDLAKHRRKSPAGVNHTHR